MGLAEPRLEPRRQFLETFFQQEIDFIGDPGGARTPNPLLRRQVLYPVELRDLARSACPDLSFGGRSRVQDVAGKG